MSKAATLVGPSLFLTLLLCQLLALPARKLDSLRRWLITTRFAGVLHRHLRLLMSGALRFIVTKDVQGLRRQNKSVPMRYGNRFDEVSYSVLTGAVPGLSASITLVRDPNKQ